MPEMTEREQVLRDLVADLREECAEKDDKIEQQTAEIAILSQKNPNGDRNPSPGDPCGRSCEGQAYRIELRQALAKVEALKALLSDIKLFEVDSGVERIKKGEPAFALPLALRKRMQAVLDNAEQTGQ